MNLGQLFARIARSPVGDLELGGGDTGALAPDAIPQVFDAVTEALKALYTRFPLRTKTLTLATIDGIFNYPLRTEFAQTSGSAEANKFIQDTVADPFKSEDLLAIEHVLDGDRYPLPLNVRNSAVSWFTAEYDVLAMDYPLTGTSYFVQYRANHPVLALEFLEPGDPEEPATLTPATLAQKISCPQALELALMARIGYELFCTQTSENAIAKALELLQKYEGICGEIEQRNTVNSSIVEDRSDVINLGGWA